MRLLLLLAALAASSAAAQNGTLDPSFGAGGRVVLDPSGTLRSAAADVAVLPDGRILLAGRVGTDAAVIRLTEAGALDPTYGDGGVRTVDLGGPQDVFLHLVVFADGSALAVGTAVDATDIVDGGALARLTPGGALDPSFGEGGRVLEAGRIAYFFSAVVLADGRIVAAGAAQKNEGDPFAVARYLGDGTPDPDFGTGGLVVPDLGDVGLLFPSLAVDSQGRLVVGASSVSKADPFEFSFTAARLTPTGAPDPTFGGDGIAVTDLGPTFDVVQDVAVDAQDRVWVAGGALDVATGTGDLVVTRHTDDGDPDATFGSGGILRSGIDGAAADLVLQSDGRFLVGGAAGPNGSSDLLVARYTEAGTPDLSFGTGGQTRVDFGAVEQGGALVLSADGRVLLAGATGDVNGDATSLAVARFLTDGRPVAAETTPAGTLDGARLALAAAPNPFGDATAVTLTLAHAGAARVAAFDALGRRVAVLHDGPLPAGARTFRLDGSALAPGVYVVRADGAFGGAALRIVRR